MEATEDQVIVPLSTFNHNLGAIVNDCQVSTSVALEEVCDFLQIYDETDSTCYDCNTKIKNCLVCSDLDTCDLCYAGYRPVKSLNPDGTVFTACVYDFCGYDVEDQNGFTNDCNTCDELSHCLHCEMLEDLTETGSVH